MTNSSKLHSPDPTPKQDRPGEMLALLNPEAYIYIVNIIE